MRLSQPRPRTMLRAVVLMVFLGFIALLLAKQWPEVRQPLGHLSGWAVLGASLAVVAGHLATFLSWRALLSDLDSPLRPVAGLRVFFLGQLGKYVPGSVWPVVTQLELGRDHGVPRRVSGATAAAALVFSVGTGLLVAVALVPLGGLDPFGRWQWTALVIPVAILLAAPPVLNRLLELGLRLVRLPPLPRPLSLAGGFRSAGWALVARNRRAKAGRSPRSAGEGR